MEQKQDSNDLKRVHTISRLSRLEILLFQCQNSLLKSPEAKEESGEGSYKDKKASRSNWTKVRKLLYLLKLKNAAAKNDDSRGGESIGRNHLEEDLKSLRSLIGRIKAILKDGKEYNAHTGEAKTLEDLANDLTGNLKEIISRGPNFRDMQKVSDDIHEISLKIFSLKSQILGTDLYLPGLHRSKTFLESLSVMEKIQNLELLHMLCLLSFAVFPENREVKKTMLMYWWIGEGFLSTKGAEAKLDEGAEAKADKILGDFIREGLIEPVKDDRRLKPNSYKMEPHVHSAVIDLAERLGLFAIYNKKGKPFMKRSHKDKVCLVEGSWWQQEAKVSWWQQDGKVSKPNELNYVKTLFNSSERFPDFTFKWFPHMSALKVLYLGRWERTHDRHIEVESTKFLKDIKSMKELSLASFQGISRIEKLDDNICQLPKLVILDLRSCYNLEALPEEIDLLENLIYLDVSECFMLDRMPKEISQLKKLRVLKGFVVSDAEEETCCTLSQLKDMNELRKLTISINKYDVKEEDLWELMTKLTRLESLKIAWGARFPKDRDGEKWRKEHKKAWRRKEKSHRANEKQGGPTTKSQNKSVSEKDIDKRDDKGGTSKMEKGDAEGKGMSLKSDKVVGENKKTSPSQEPKEVIPKKPDDHKGDDKEKKKDGSKEVDREESKEHGGEEAKSQESDKVIEEKKEVISSQEPKGLIQGNSDDPKGDNREQRKEDGKKERGGEEAEAQKSDKVVEEDNKMSPSKESKEPLTQMNPDDHKGDDKEKIKEDRKNVFDHDGGKEHGGEGLETQKSDKVVEEDSQVSPSKESKEPLTQKNPDDHKGDNEEQIKEDGKKEVVQEESKKRGGEEVEAHKSDKVVEEDKKVSHSQESKEPLIQKNPNDIKGDSKEQEKEKEDEKREDADVRDSKERDGGGERNQNDKIVEEDKKPIASQESKPTAQKETEDHKRERKGKTKPKGGKKSEQDGVEKDPPNLKKLELECFPGKRPPSWLNPKDLEKLEKLSIRGGKLSSIGHGETLTRENKWLGVKVLRLKYLDAFKAEWKYLHEMFPDIELLEKYKCPKVTFCPTNGNGVWRSSQSQASTQKPE